MTKKKQSKRSAKQGAKKTSGSGVAPTLQEIPAMEPVRASQDAQALSAPEPLQASQDAQALSQPEPLQASQDAQALSAPEPLQASLDAQALSQPEPLQASLDAQALSQPEPLQASQDAQALSQPEPLQASQDAQALSQPEPLQASQDAQALSQPEPIQTEPVAPDLAVEPQSNQTPKFTPLSAKPVQPTASPEQSKVEESSPSTSSPSPSSPSPSSPSPSITNDIPGPPAIAAIQEPSTSQKTTYDIEAMESTSPVAPAQDIAAAPTHTSPALNPQSLGSLTRSKSSSEVSRGLPGKEEPAPKWRPPVDYFGASASAFSSSFSGSLSRDPNAIKRPGDAQQSPAASAQPPAGSSNLNNQSNPSTHQTPPAQPVPPAVYESGTDTAALSPKMAKFISSLREREITASGASSPALPQLESTSVEITPIAASPVQPAQSAQSAQPTQPAQPQQPPQPPIAPPKISPVTSVKNPEPKMESRTAPTAGSAAGSASAPGPISAQTSRDLTPMVRMPEQKGPRPEPKAFDDELPLAPKSSSQVAELRESIISQRADAEPEDWHPVPAKKPPRSTDPHLSADLDDFKKPDKQRESDRHLSLEEMAALDPDLLLPAQTPAQQSIRRLKSKTTGGIHAEIYIPIYIVCLGLSWVTEQSAAAGTCRDAGQRIESALQLLAPKTLADNFRAGSNAYDDRENKLHPFNPNRRPNAFQLMLSRIQALCSGLSSAFGRIPATITASSAINPLAEIMILLTYLSILVLSLLIFFKIKRSTNWSIADFILLPIGLVAGSTLITAVLIAVLSMSASLAAGYLPNTIILYTTIAVVLAVLDMARRSFLGRKQAIVRD